MEEWLNHFSQLAQDNVTLAYIFLFLSAYIENVFPPIPGDTVTLIGAYFVGRGKLSYPGVLISTTIGSVAGFMTLFLLAYWLEWKVIEKRHFSWIQKSHIDRVQAWFRKYGFAIILFNRFLSGVRSVISVTAGLSKLSVRKVFWLSTIGAVIWNGLIIFAGAAIGKNWQEILHYIKLYNKIVMVALGIIIAGYFFYTFYKKRNRRRT